jgi:VanZ family protein
VAHLVVYALLCGALIYAFPDRCRRSAKGVVVTLSIIFCLLYGVSDEFHQSFIPGRFPSIADIAADVIGAALACMLWLLWDKTNHTGRTRKGEAK